MYTDIINSVVYLQKMYEITVEKRRKHILDECHNEFNECSVCEKISSQIDYHNTLARNLDLSFELQDKLLKKGVIKPYI